MDYGLRSSRVVIFAFLVARAAITWGWGALSQEWRRQRQISGWRITWRSGDGGEEREWCHPVASPLRVKAGGAVGEARNRFPAQVVDSKREFTGVFLFSLSSERMRQEIRKWCEVKSRKCSGNLVTWAESTLLSRMIISCRSGRHDQWE